MAKNSTDREFYGRRAVSASAEAPAFLWQNMILDKQIRLIPKGLYHKKVVLDAGCGDGRLTRYLAKSGARCAIGADISDDYMKTKSGASEIVLYNKRFALAGAEKVFFVQSDAVRIPLRSNSVDTIIAFALFHHIDGKAGFISECRRVLAEGGHLVVVDPNGTHFLRTLANKAGKRFEFLTETEEAVGLSQFKRILEKFKFFVLKEKSESFFGDAAAHLSFIAFKKNRVVGRMIQYLTLLCYGIDAFLDETLFKICPNLGWRYFVLSRKE